MIVIRKITQFQELIFRKKEILQILERNIRLDKIFNRSICANVVFVKE